MLRPLPGLPAMAALMLCAMFAAWLGLWGPIDIAKLKGWQTLLGSFFAVGAALIAYFGSLAKVNLDRDIDQRNLRRTERAIHLRTRFAAMVMAHDAAEFLAGFMPGGKKFVWRQPRFRTTDAIEDAWSHLEVFPGRIAEKLFDLKRNLTNYENLRTQFADGEEINAFSPDRKIIEMRGTCNDICGIAKVIEVELGKLTTH